MTYVIAYDIGTTGVKTCLFGIDRTITLLGARSALYGLYLLPGGGAEQDGDEWWSAMCSTTRALLADAEAAPGEIAGLSFCSQMQGMVLVDQNGVPVHRPMSYMDQRARRELREGMAHGLQIAGANAELLLRSLRATGAAACSVKDPVWKYKWVERNEPEAFRRAYKWLDVKEYLLCRCTGRFVMTEDSAYATLLYDTRKGREGWCGELVRRLGVRPEHLAEIVRSTDVVGGLTAGAAAELGLAAGTPVFGGGGDASLIGVGAGCVRTGDTHIYCGTSGWVSTVLDRQKLDLGAMIAAIVGAQSGKYNYFAEMETAGKCLEWVKDHLALDEIGIYLRKASVADGPEAAYASLYDYMSAVIAKAPPGAGGVLFTPWLHGNRCPFEDPNAAGMFFNIRLETGKTELIRAVVEGVCYHLRWMLERQEKKVRTSDPVRFVGGGALSPETCQILADVLGRAVETVASPQYVGAVGAAGVMGVGLGLIPSLDAAGDFVPVVRRFVPEAGNREVYDRGYAVFTKLYAANKTNFRLLNGRTASAGSQGDRRP